MSGKAFISFLMLMTFAWNDTFKNIFVDHKYEWVIKGNT